MGNPFEMEVEFAGKSMELNGRFPLLCLIEGDPKSGI